VSLDVFFLFQVRFTSPPPPHYNLLDLWHFGQSCFFREPHWARSLFLRTFKVDCPACSSIALPFGDDPVFPGFPSKISSLIALKAFPSSPLDSFQLISGFGTCHPPLDARGRGNRLATEDLESSLFCRIAFSGYGPGLEPSFFRIPRLCSPLSCLLSGERRQDVTTSPFPPFAFILPPPANTAPAFTDANTVAFPAP